MFTFKGISTKDMKIIVEEPENLIAKAPLKHEVLNIEGRDDAIYYPLGYAPVEIPLTLQLLDPSKIDQVLMWLNGEGELIYKNRKTKARIFSEIQPIRTSGIRIINIEIIRAPFWYALEDDYSEAWGANLIPNGWDSFITSGRGKNYVLDFDNKTTNFKLSETILGGTEVYILFKGERGSREYLSILNEDNKWLAELWWLSGSVQTHIDGLYALKTTLARDAIEINLRGGIPDEFYICDLNSPCLVYSNKPLGNGLNHIQTWGGTAFAKLRLATSVIIEKKSVWSFYLINNGKYRMTPTVSKPKWNEQTFHRDYEGLVEIELAKQEDSVPNVFTIGAYDDNLDFIASDPQIVEGEKLPTWEADENPRIINEGTAPSKPLIKLTKGTTNTCEFEVNGVYFKYHFNNDDHVLIDCDKMEASDNGQLRNRHLTIGFEFPVLEPGPNVVKRISGDAKIEFSRKDRWL